MKQGPDGIFISQRKYTVDLQKGFKWGTLTLLPWQWMPMRDAVSWWCWNGDCYMWFKLFVSHKARHCIAFSVGVVSRFRHNTSKLDLGGEREHWHIAEAWNLVLVSANFQIMWLSREWLGRKHWRYINITRTSCHMFSLGSGAFSRSSKKRELKAYQLRRLSILQQLYQLVKQFG